MPQLQSQTLLIQLILLEETGTVATGRRMAVGSLISMASLEWQSSVARERIAMIQRLDPDISDAASAFP